MAKGRLHRIRCMIDEVQVDAAAVADMASAFVYVLTWQHEHGAHHSTALE